MLQTDRLAIFDVDGTLADNYERVEKFLNKKPKDYDGYYANVLDDPPIKIMCDLLCSMYVSGEFDIQVWTSRRMDCQTQTIKWLKEYCAPFTIEPLMDNRARTSVSHNVGLRMRPMEGGNKEPDYKLKGRWLACVRDWYGYTDILAFDDRQRVVDMYDQAGIRVLQPATGGDF